VHRWVGAALAVAFVLGVSVVTGPHARAATAPPGAPTKVTATAGTLSATVKWTPADATATTFTVVSNPGGVSTSVAGTATSATVTGLGFGLAYSFTVSGTNSAGAGPSSAASNFVTPLPPGSPYHAVPSVPILNTDITAGQPLASNLGDDPAHFTGLTAVVLNVTASQATVATSVQLVLNLQVVQTIPVAVGQQESTLAVIAVPAQLTQGAVQVTSGKAHVEVDFAGYLTAPSTLKDHSGLLQMLPVGALFSGTIATGASTDIPVLGHAGVPSAHVAAVLVNVTASGSAAGGGLSLRPSGSFALGATAVGFGSGQTSADRAIVPVPSNGAITLSDRGAAATARVEALGWFSDGTDTTAFGSVYTPLPPARLVDTTATGGPLLAGDTIGFAVWGKGGAPDSTATAPPTSAVLLVTAMTPAGAGSLSIAGSLVVDFAAAATVSNLDVVKLASDGSAAVSAIGANTNVTVDLVGYLSGDLIVPGSTKVLPAGLLAGITSLTDTSVTFAPGVQASPPILLNDVINARVSPTTPFGFLRRVVSIGTDPAGETALTTRNASLPEALTAYDVSWTAPPRSGAFGMHQGVGGPVRASLPPFQPPPGTSIDPRWPVLTLAGNGTHLIFPVSASFSALSGQLDISDLELQLVPHVAFGNSPFTNPQFAVGLSVGLRFQASVSILGTIASQTWTPYDKEYRTFPPDEIPVGPIVVVVQALIELKVTVDLTLQGGIQATINADKYGLITAGYDKGAFFANFQGKDYIPAGKTITDFAPTLQAEVRPGFHFIGGVVLYGFAVLAGDDNPYVRFTVDPLGNPWWEVAAGICQHIVIGIDIVYAFTRIFTKEATIDLPCNEIVFLSAPGPLIAVTITPSPATVPRGGTQTFNATVAGVPVPVAWSLVEANAGTLSNVALKSVDYTAPSRAGTYHLEAAAVADPTSKQVIAITVPATAPGLATNVTATLSGGTSVNLTWSAPTDDGGVAITDYKVVSSDGTVIDAGTNTVTTFINLTPGTTYTFSVYATNSANLTSAASLSPPVTVPTQAVVTLTPTLIDFGVNSLGTPSQPQTVTVSASGGSLHVTSVTLGGTRPQDYSIVSDLCSGLTIDPLGSCTFQVVFTAAIQNQSTATALVTDDALGSPQSMALKGQGPLPLINGFSGAGPAQFFDLQHGTVGNFNTADGGTTWTPQQFAGGYPGFLNYGAYFLDPSHGWELGAPFAAFTPGCIPGASCKVVLYTSDGGVTWTRLSVINFLLRPSSMVFTDALHGWIVGLSYTCDATGNNCVQQGVLATTDGGLTWAAQPLPDPETCAAPLTLDKRSELINMIDSQNGWILGVSACLDSVNTASSPLTLAWSTSNGGATWSVHDTGLNAYYFISYSRLHSTGPNQLAFATQDFSGDNSAIFVSTADGGTTWTKSKIPDLFAGDFQYTDATHVVLIGGGNGSQSLYTSGDSGATWTRVGPLPGQVPSSNPNPNFTELHFLTVVDATHWWITGQIDYVSSTGASSSGGLILLSSDGGVTWKIVLEGTGS